jgi:XTP/dITP diphosphohydrolase
MTTLVLSTRNRHKVGEIRALLPTDISVLTLADFPSAPDVVEDAGTFAGNAAKKARELAAWLGHPPGAAVLAGHGVKDPAKVFVLADDSGLEVDALEGAPGVHSARFAALDTGAAGNSKDADNNAKLLRLLAGLPLAQRTARFRCVIALVSVPTVAGGADASFAVDLFDGACEGQILGAPRGVAGFGYDPLFVPNGFSETFSELGEETKNRISHRAQALAKLRQHWR